MADDETFGHGDGGGAEMCERMGSGMGVGRDDRFLSEVDHDVVAEAGHLTRGTRVRG